MAEANGSNSRLDRIELAIEKLAENQRALNEGQRVLTSSHLSLVSSVDRVVTAVAGLSETVNVIGLKFAEVEDKLNGLAGLIENDHREFHERIKRLESH